MTKEALNLALEALENSVDLVREDAYSAEQLYGNYPARQGKVRGLKALVEDHEKAITAIKAALVNEALERKAENAKDLGLNYEPDWKEEYQKAVDLHCITLDELREADAWIKNLEKLMANQDAMLERQTARIVELQEHIDNFDGEDR